MRSCVHFAKRRTAILRNSDVLLQRIVFPATKQNNKIKASKVLCQCCEDSRLDPLMVCCMECACFGCLKHLRLHLHARGHTFALSTNFGEIFCYKCNDFIYDRRFEKRRSEFQNARRKNLGLSLQHRWNPGRVEVRLCRRTCLRVLPQLGVGSGQNSLGRGLRGLVNLGNTCFMNCIIQTLLHIPMLRDYFLSDQHHCKLGGSSAAIATNAMSASLTCSNSKQLMNNICLMCELSHIFQEFYRDENHRAGPYVPHRLLHLVWTHAKHLSGYEQHDAHEFLISALNILHRHSESISMKQNPHECKCIIDRLFTGQLQSDLTCTKCGRISTKLDPYWDISLELLNGKQQQHIGGRLSSLASSPAICSVPLDEFGGVKQRTLEECLKNFVRAENLNARIKCDNCGTYEVSIKQLTLHKLPIVACFHLKRFEHNAANKRQKIKNPVRFPEFIDLSPYTTSHRNNNNSMGNNAMCGAGDEPSANTRSSSSSSASSKRISALINRYSLFAVVNHTGSTESGHYTCFIRHQHNWFNCNDQKIRKERLEDVLDSEGYLLFYCKSYIEYD